MAKKGEGTVNEVWWVASVYEVLTHGLGMFSKVRVMGAYSA